MINAQKLAAGSFAAVLLFTGCGKAAEKLTEKAIEQGSGCENVDVNADDGNASLNCDGQNVSTDGKAPIPDGFPDELRPPDGAKIYFSGTEDNTDGTKTFNLSVSIQEEAEAVADALRSQFTDNGYEITDDSVSTGTSGVGGTIEARNDTWKVTAVFGQNTTGTDDGGTYVQMVVRGLTESEASENPGGSDTTEGATDTTEGSSGPSAGGDLPDGFPAALAPPDDATIIYANRNVSNGKTSYSVAAGLTGTVADIFEAVKGQLTDAGFEIVNDNLTEAAGESFGSISASGPEYTAAVSVNADSSDEYEVIVTMNLAQV